MLLLRLLDATVAVLHLRERELAKERSTKVEFTKVFLLRISSPDIMPVLGTRYIIDMHNENAGLFLCDGLGVVVYIPPAREDPETHLPPRRRR